MNTQDNTKPADAELRRHIDTYTIYAFGVLVLRNDGHYTQVEFEAELQNYKNQLVESILKDRKKHQPPAPTVDTGELRKDFDFQQQRIWQLPTSTVLERQTVEFIYNWVAKQVAAAHQQGVPEVLKRVRKNSDLEFYLRNENVPDANPQEYGEAKVARVVWDAIDQELKGLPTTEKGTE